MKKLFLSGLILLGLGMSYAYGEAPKAAPGGKKAKDTASDTLKVKTGWSWSALPCLSFSSDLGFQVGAFGHFYYHGDGSHYPQPVHDIGWEGSWFTHGRTRAYLSYDSKFLIPKTRFNGSVTYVNDPLYAFYGFNGAAQLYNKPRGAAEYGLNRNMVRVLADFQGEILPNFQWAAGVAYWGFWTKSIQGRFAEKYFDEIDGTAVDNTLYRQYVDAGLIRQNEKDGGHNLEFKAGLVYDSRDQEAAPNKGIWAEAYVYGSPDLFKCGGSYMKLAAHMRQYITLPVHWANDGGMVFAYHLAYQGKLAGDVPFYVQQNINTLILRQMISEGLGSSNSVRGMLANRIIADGVAWLNADLRIKVVSFKLWKQFFYVGICPFYDMGMTVQPYRADEHFAFVRATENPELTREEYNKMVYTPVHNIGLGVKIGWNENFIASVEVAKCLNDIMPGTKGRNMGDKLWVSIGVGYAF